MKVKGVETPLRADRVGRDPEMLAEGTGECMPYSGPASAYATIGKTKAAYFKRLNEEGGINGRRIES